MYELISQLEADRIKEILCTIALIEPIEIEEGDFKLRAFSVSSANPSENHSNYDMQEVYLLNKDDCKDVLQYKNKFYEIFMNIGEWGYNENSRLDKTHITLGYSLHTFCLQLELSQAFKDNEYIYVVKSVSNLGGPGAMTRLYSGLNGKQTLDKKDKKLKRLELFIQGFGGEVLNFYGKDWVCISKIKIQDLYNDDKAEEIFYDLVYSMFFAMLLVERIGKGDKKENIRMTEEIPTVQQLVLKEGAKTTVVVNAYERNPKARNQCIKYYKTLNNGKVVCEICGFDFGEFYGEELEGRIHVHHLKPLHEIGEEYEIDAINELIPICPNCHLVIHSKEPAYNPNEVKKMIKKYNLNKNNK